jgi:hypothetical protein
MPVWQEPPHSNRQSRRFKCEGIDLSVSTLADQVGAGAFAVRPIFELVEAYVLSADRLHGDDTKIPILAKGKAHTGRIWTYVRDDLLLKLQHHRRACRCAFVVTILAG